MKYALYVSILLLLSSTLSAQSNDKLCEYWEHIEECEQAFSLYDTLNITQNQIECILRDTIAFHEYSDQYIVPSENIVIVLLINAHYQWINKNNSKAIDLLNQSEIEFLSKKKKIKKRLGKDFGVFEYTFIEHKKLFQKIKNYLPPPIKMAKAELIALMPKFENLLRPTSRYDCTQYFTSCPDLFCVDEKISRSISRCGYNEKSYFYINNGYVVTLRLERTDENCSYFCDAIGSSNGPCSCRFKYNDVVFERHNNNSLSLKEVSEYISALFFGRVAYFRLFIFVVTDNFLPTQNRITEDEALSWIEKGSSWLPNETAMKKFTSDYSVNCWVYEYQAKDSQKILRFVPNSGNSAYHHLQKSGILKELLK